MTNTMHELFTAADYAAAKTDRWLFIAILIAGAIVTLFASRWLIGRYESLLGEHRADQQQFTTTILNVTAEQNKTAKELAVCLDRCACALEENTTQLRLVRENRK